MSFRRRHVRATARAQRGQALIWLIGVMGAAIAVLYGIYNVTQVSVGKEKAVNAADTAALAGAKVEARMLNLMAYNNRSMIANEVALVQFASMDAWLGYFAKTAQNIGGVLEWIPYVNEIGVLLKEFGDAAQYARDYVTTYALDAVIVATEFEKDALGIAHGLIRTGGWMVARDAAKATVAANRANFNGHDDAGVALESTATDLLVGKHSYDWWNLTQMYSGSQRDEVAKVIQDSRDSWSTNRPGQWYMNFTVPLLPPQGVKKLGPTVLADFDHWQTEDTWEHWIWTPSGNKWSTIGDGRTNVTTDGNDKGRMAPGHAGQKDAQKDEKTHRYWTGMPSLYDLPRYKTLKEKQAAGVDFAVVVVRDQSANLTTSRLQMGHDPGVSPIGASNMDERLAGDRVAAIGNAKTFFERPAATSGDKTGKSLFRSDTSKEYGSLYSPYWEARLLTVDSGLKLSVYTALKITPKLSFWTP